MTLEERIKIVSMAGSDLAFREEFNALCASNVDFFINTCLFICEPRAGADLTNLPFLLRGFQEDYVRQVDGHINSDKDLLTDKTREMGVTWMVEAVLLHHWLFERGFVAIVSSITEDKIDKPDDPSCLFWKFDFMIESLRWSVPWLYPDGYVKARPNRTHMKLFNPATGSIINGEVMGKNLGRSGRAKVIFPDEFAEAAYPADSWASSSRSTNCRLPVFTPKGMNFAGRLANPPKGRKRSVDRITLHWMLDETKNYYEVTDRKTKKIIAFGNGEAPEHVITSLEWEVKYPWYETAKARIDYDDVKIAQELDVNYADSASDLMYPQIRRARYGTYPYNPAFPLYATMDYGVGDMCTIVWVQYNHLEKRFVFIDCFQRNARTIHWYIPFLLGSEYLYLGQAEGGYTPDEVRKIHDHNAYKGKYTAFYGDPSGKNRNQVTNTSVISEMAKFGILTKTNHKMNTYEVRHKLTQKLLLNSDFDEDMCAGVIDALENSKFKQSSDDKFKPIHDEFSHYRTAVEFLAVNHTHGFNAAIPGKASELIEENIQEYQDKIQEEEELAQLYPNSYGLIVPMLNKVEIDPESRQIVHHGPHGEIRAKGPFDLLKVLRAKEREQERRQKLLSGKDFSKRGYRR